MNQNLSLEYNTIGTRIRTAIIDADRTSIRKILDTLDSSQVKHHLDNKTDGEDHISLALRLGRRQIAIELFLRSLFEIDEWPYEPQNFTWLNLFDFVGNATINQLQERLKHAKPFAMHGDIDLKSLAKNLKYLKVAYLLGAPCQEGKLLGDLILEAHEFVLGRQRCWDLIKSKICRRFPLSVSKTANWLVNDTENTRELLKNYPDWFEDTDEHGNNILHCALLMDDFSAGPFTYIWPIKSGSVTTEKLVKLILQKNDEGQTPLVLYIKKSYSRIPIEFHIAIKQLVDTGDTKTINEILAIPKLYNKEHRDDNMSIKIFLHAFFIQHGYANAASKQVLKEFGKIEDIGLFLHHFDKKGNVEQPKNMTEEEKEPESTKDTSIMTRVKDYFSPLKALAMTRVKNCFSPTVKIETPYMSNTTFYDLPTDVIFHFAESLKPSDLLTFAMCNKQLNNQFKVLMNSYEQFWKQYHHAHLHLVVPEPQTTYRDHIRTQFKLRNAWYNNKYSTITLPDKYTTMAMDENWLVMSDKSEQYCYWNCHTHEIIESNVKRIAKAADHTILNTYESGSLPTLFDGRNIIRGNQMCRLNSCKDIRSILYNKTYPIDHRVILRCNAPHWNSFVVNTETDCIEHRLDRWCWHNPFNNTLISYNQSKIHVTDLRDRPRTFNYDTDLQLSHPDFRFADEHTMFYHDYDEAGFVDLRNFKTISSVNLQSNVDLRFSKERVLLVADSQLLVSWHLPSRKIEWIEPAVHWPTFANSRYLVMGSHLQISKFVIRDYYK